MKKVTRLKRKWVFVIGVIVGIMTVMLLRYTVDNYKDYLKQCDHEKGYTCNIFGK